MGTALTILVTLWVQGLGVSPGFWLAHSGAALHSPQNPMRLVPKAFPSQLRSVVIGLILVLVLRFAPRGLIPEAIPEALK